MVVTLSDIANMNEKRKQFSTVYLTGHCLPDPLIWSFRPEVHKWIQMVWSWIAFVVKVTAVISACFGLRRMFGWQISRLWKDDYSGGFPMSSRAMVPGYNVLRLESWQKPVEPEWRLHARSSLHVCGVRLCDRAEAAPGRASKLGAQSHHV